MTLISEIVAGVRSSDSRPKTISAIAIVSDAFGPDVTELDAIATATWRAAPDDVARIGLAVAHALGGSPVEIVLTGVDLTAYGADLPGKPSLGRLVRELLAAVPELRRLRLSCARHRNRQCPRRRPVSW